VHKLIYQCDKYPGFDNSWVFPPNSLYNAATLKELKQIRVFYM